MTGQRFSAKLLIMAVLMATAPGAFATASLFEPAAEQVDSRLGATGPTVNVEGNNLQLTARGTADCTFSIYSIVGHVVATVKVKAGDTESVELKAGCYVVRCDHWSKKVIVR